MQACDLARVPALAIWIIVFYFIVKGFIAKGEDETLTEAERSDARGGIIVGGFVWTIMGGILMAVLGELMVGKCENPSWSPKK